MIERRAVVAEDRQAVVIRTAAQKFHEVRAVGELEAEHICEEWHLIVDARTVEHDMADLGRTRAVEHRIRMVHQVGGDAHWQTVRCFEPEAVPATRTRWERRRIGRDVNAVSFGFGAKRINRGAIRGSKMHGV